MTIVWHCVLHYFVLCCIILCFISHWQLTVATHFTSVSGTIECRNERERRKVFQTKMLEVTRLLRYIIPALLDSLMGGLFGLVCVFSHSFCFLFFLFFFVYPFALDLKDWKKFRLTFPEISLSLSYPSTTCWKTTRWHFHRNSRPQNLL